MAPSTRRRALLSSTVLAGFAGCFDGESDAEDDSERPARDEVDDGDDDACTLRNKTQRGDGDPIEFTADLSGADDVERECAQRAADAALDRLDEHLELDLRDAQWINAGWTYDISEEHHSARIFVEATIDDGTVVECPDPAFDFEEAVSLTPSDVTVVDEAGDDGASGCEHEIVLERTTKHLD